MATSQQDDTEITLGTGKILGLFFALTVLCAVFFGLGFSFGKNSTHSTDVVPSTIAAVSQLTGTKPSASPKVVTNTLEPAVPQTDNQAPVTSPTAKPDASASPASSGNGYYLQVAAVSKQEDADGLIEALKKKQYSVFLPPPSGDNLYHVQIGPFPDVKEAETTRKRLVDDGYNPIVKK
jgi:DedD protein